MHQISKNRDTIESKLTISLIDLAQLNYSELFQGKNLNPWDYGRR